MIHAISPLESIDLMKWIYRVTISVAVRGNKKFLIEGLKQLSWGLPIFLIESDL